MAGLIAGIFDKDQSYDVTVVDGTTSVGLMARDGSINVIPSDGNFGSIFHRSGAVRVTANPSATAFTPIMNEDGSVNVDTSPYPVKEIVKVSVMPPGTVSSLYPGGTIPGGGGGGGDTGGGSGDGGTVTFVQLAGGLTTGGQVQIHGKVKPGATGKFLYNMGVPAAGTLYRCQYLPDFSLLSQHGKLAMVGFGCLGSGSQSFFMTGLKGDGGTGLKDTQILGAPPNGWNKQTGQTVITGNSPHYGTQAGPNFIEIDMASSGTSYTFKTGDGVTYQNEIVNSAVTPFINISQISTFGPAVWIDNADGGTFNVTFSLWKSV